MVKIYRFITEDDTADFCHRVTEALSKGWALYGSPQYAFDNKCGVMRAGQAVVKETDVVYSKTMKLSDL